MQKSEKVLLRATNKNLWGGKIILPTIGETIVEANGNLEVEDTVATLLLTKTDSYQLVKGNGTTVTEELYADKLAEEVVLEVKEQEVTSIKEETSEQETKEEDGLDEMTLSELKEIAEQAGFTEEDYSKYAKSKKLMINFLRKNAK
jgi:hypothetical protein